MQMHLTITRGDTVTPLTAGPAAITEWEATTGGNMAEWAKTPPRFTDLAILAWAAENPTEPRPPFTEWVQSIDDLDIADAPAANPTKAAKSPAS